MANGQSTRFEAVREKLEDTRSQFLHLLDTIPEKDWERRHPGEGWTIKQEMVHIVQVVSILSNGIIRASQGSRRSLLAIVPPGLRSWFNGYIIIPLLARRATRQSIGEAYNKAHKTLLDILAGLPEEAWSKGIPYPRKYRSVEQLALRPAEHFEEHLEHLRNMPGFKMEDLESGFPSAEGPKQ